MTARLRISTLIAAIAAIAALAAGCGGDGGDAGADPIELAPPSSVVWARVDVRPEGDQKEAIEQIVRRVAGVDDVGAQIEAQFDRLLAENLGDDAPNFEEGIRSWLGEQAGVAVSPLGEQGEDLPFAVSIASKDNDKARELIDADPTLSVERDYEGVEYRTTEDEELTVGVVEDFLVIGNEEGMRAAIDASKGDSLADTDEFSDSAAVDADEKFAVLYVDSRGLLEALGSTDAFGPQGAILQQFAGQADTGPVVATLDVAADRIALDITGEVPQRAEAQVSAAEIVAGLPGDAWAGLGIPGLSETADAILEQVRGQLGAAALETFAAQLRSETGIDLERDVLPSLGDLGLFVRGTNPLEVGGGVVMSGVDTAAALRLIASTRALAAEEGANVGPAPQGTQGFSLAFAELPSPLNVVVADGKLAVVLGDEATREALDPSSTLADSESYQRARSSLDGTDPAIFVAFEPIATLASAAGADDSPEGERFVRALRALDTLAAGSTREGDTQTARVVLTLK